MGRIYIAGKVTGVDGYAEKFAKAEAYLNEIGYAGNVVNPVKIMADLPPDSTSYRDYIKIGLSLLDTCDEIYMLKDWPDSKGATLEVAYAVALGYIVWNEGDEEIKYVKEKMAG